jgi:singapore isolate B (sub-type 7) whole genome shotgun sequence assembly, scaffold_4
MINALHPIDKKEGEEEPHIRNQEAWQLTRWLEEGVFGSIYPLHSF